jgi:hypothetical protein
MFEQLITIGELLISGLRSLRLKKDKKRSLGKHLSSLYRDLSILLENGDKILELFMQHNDGKSVDIDEIKRYLLEQDVLIPRLANILGKKNIQTILSIQAPAITPLQFLLFDKGLRIKFYLEKFDEQERQGSGGAYIEWISSDAKLDLPNNNSIAHSKKQLRNIQSLTEELRKYIVEHFETDEII